MGSTNFIVALVGLLTSAILIQHFESKKTKEKFAGLNYPISWKINREVKTSPNDMYSVSGNFQSSLSPRFSNVNYGSNIRFNLPSYDNMGVPNNPITYDYDKFQNNNVKENFTQIPGMVDWNKIPMSENDVESNYATPAYNRQMKARSGNGGSNSGCVAASARSGNEYTDVTDMLPVSDMETVASTMNRQGPEIQSRAAKQTRSGVQPVVYDRFIYANAKSNLRRAADPVRGDLPIVPVLPESNRNSTVLFRPSVSPHIDLERGYLTAAGGSDNTTNNQLRSLMNASVDGTLSTFGGSNIPVQRNVLRGGQGDIVISNFS